MMKNIILKISLLSAFAGLVLVGGVSLVNQPVVQKADATFNIPKPEYPNPKDILCENGQPNIENNQKFSLKVGQINVSYRWKIKTQDATSVTYKLQVDLNPTNNETWVDVAGETRTVQIPECPQPNPCDEVEEPYLTKSSVIDEISEPCEEEPETPQPGGWSPEPEGNKSTTNAPGVCSINDIGDVANIYVDSGTPNDNKVEVQWSLPQNADQVHIMYGEYGKPYEHALLNTANDGNEVIGGLKNGVNYNFKVAGVRGCGVGNYSKEFDPMP